MQKTCLIAAHDPWFIQLLKIYSEECGLRVLHAFDGQEVLSLVRSENPAGVLLQMDLPGAVKSGDIIKSLRNDPKTKQIPVIVFSWQNSYDDDRGDTEGSTAHLKEPITYEIFVSTLRSAGLIMNEAARFDQYDQTRAKQQMRKTLK
jgi:CheY-like chemotaxis protein